MHISAVVRFVMFVMSDRQDSKCIPAVQNGGSKAKTVPSALIRLLTALYFVCASGVGLIRHNKARTYGCSSRIFGQAVQAAL